MLTKTTPLLLERACPQQRLKLWENQLKSPLEKIGKGFEVLI